MDFFAQLLWPAGVNHTPAPAFSRQDDQQPQALHDIAQRIGQTRARRRNLRIPAGALCFNTLPDWGFKTQKQPAKRHAENHYASGGP
ncbi:hypothetical protein SRABI106_02953 [Rahnella aquatilis]|nr:hypothetical protein SRABI106_02953 [Rahnella aquatilis]